MKDICSTSLLLVNLFLLNKPTRIFSCSETTLVNIYPNNGHYTSFDNQALQGHVISSLQTRNSFQCAGKCKNNEDCKSFNYSPNSQMCELNNGDHLTHSEDFVTRQRSKYYYYDWSKFSGKYKVMTLKLNFGLTGGSILFFAVGVGFYCCSKQGQGVQLHLKGHWTCLTSIFLYLVL